MVFQKKNVSVLFYFDGKNISHRNGSVLTEVRDLEHSCMLAVNL